ncbi:MAG: protein CpxP [Flavobacterium sp.]|jgi:protein CpxP
MNKTKLLSIAVIALLLLNFGILSFLFFSKGNHPRDKKMPREIIIEKLHFSKNQIFAYEKTIEIHQNTIRDLDNSIRETKNELYQLLNSDKIDSVQKNSLFIQLANYQREIETTHFNHFLDIKKICTKEQLADYNDLTKELGRIFGPNRKPKHD